MWAGIYRFIVLWTVSSPSHAAWSVPATDAGEKECNLKRIDYQEILRKRRNILEVLASLSEPVLVENALHHWRALKKWQDQESFLRDYGRGKLSSSLQKNAPQRQFLERTDRAYVSVAYTRYETSPPIS